MNGGSPQERGRALIGGAVIASVTLIVVFLVLGGSSYAPAEVGDPCKPRPWRNPQGVGQTVEQFSLSALDGTACDLHVSRETLVLALATPDGRRRFADDPRLENAVRAGLERAIDDAERAGALSPLLADGLRDLARHAPASEVISLIQDAAPIFEGAQGLLDQIPGLPGLPIP